MWLKKPIRHQTDSILVLSPFLPLTLTPYPTTLLLTARPLTMFSKKFFILATFLLPAISAPSPLLTIPRTANSIPDRHIITLKKGVSRAAHVNTFQSKRASSPSNITHEWDIINGYAGHFSPEDLEGLRAHPDVASIEHDAIVRGSEIVTQCVYLSPPEESN